MRAAGNTDRSLTRGGSQHGGARGVVADCGGMGGGGGSRRPVTCDFSKHAVNGSHPTRIGFVRFVSFSSDPSSARLSQVFGKIRKSMPEYKEKSSVAPANRMHQWLQTHPRLASGLKKAKVLSLSSQFANSLSSQIVLYLEFSLFNELVSERRQKKCLGTYC